MSEKTFENLTALLDQNQARYRIVHHSAAGKSEEVAKIRGTELGQGAKALVCKVKCNGVKQALLAIPPFSFHPALKLIVDPSLLERYDELAFNAGTLEHSIILNTQDYARIVQPTLVSFVKADG
ncbi:Ala-tRNA(Pro) deacylase [Pasteurella langaaensis DSM 22999]|uniref:Ala-tRNA(Pro) deacylase n=1 Tax=Alitibacter langaaensis DSM 22999 TaxID=1122935 RepID=A0A2U0TH26_9PAST|nr:YbaK/prolyl-tRNA synthetase associated domain-containing protein [Pasteurella langaaensis]PVX42912.1 Ala-tRNA(Pro) deacylase [Pasteurella langaaensis DSM 22999]